MIRIKDIFYLILFSFLLSCALNNSKKEHNLLEHGVPLVIYGPDSISVEKQSFGSIIENYSIKGEEFNVELNVSDSHTTDLKKVINDQKELIKTDQYFDEISQDFENGFVFKRKIDSTFVSYDFRLIKLQGDKEYVFQPSLIKKYDLNQAKELYNSVLGPKKK